MSNKYSNKVPDKEIPAVKTNIKSLNMNDNTVIWLRHSSYYIQFDGMTFLIDPILSDHASPFPLIIKAFPGTDIYTADDFPEIDFLIITHDHWDHLNYQTLMALKPKNKHVVAPLGAGSHWDWQVGE